MSIVRSKSSALPKGKLNREKFDAATEDQIRAWQREEGYNDDADLVPVPAVSPRAVRERVGMTQEEFARSFRLPLRTVQEWEQSRKQPSEAARVLLFAIARDPEALATALRRGRH